MATRSLVGLYDSKDKNKLRLTYCHWDGYPRGVGETIFVNYRRIGDARKLGEFLVSVPEGWSQLADTDFTQEKVSKENRDRKKDAGKPIYYDEGDPPFLITSLREARMSGCKYIYLVNPFTEELDIYEVVYERIVKVQKNQPKSGEIWYHINL